MEREREREREREGEDVMLTFVIVGGTKKQTTKCTCASPSTGASRPNPLVVFPSDIKVGMLIVIDTNQRAPAGILLLYLPFLPHPSPIPPPSLLFLLPPPFPLPSP